MAEIKREHKMNIHNRFDIEVVDVNTGEIKQKAQAFNVVCNGYFNTVLNNWGYGSYIRFGSGTGTPAASDTQLFTHVGSKGVSLGTGNIKTDDAANGVFRLSISCSISNAEYVGTSFTEVGWATSSTLLSHAMLQDMNGNPITIAHTSTDIINIYCNVYLHYDRQGNGISISRDIAMSGFIAWALLVTGRTDWGFGYAVGTLSGNKPCTNASTTFDLTNRTVKIKGQIATGSANLSGIGCIICGNISSGTVQSGWLAIEKGTDGFSAFSVTNETIGTGDGTKVKFKTKTHYPYNAKVYVNGVEKTSGVTVKRWLSLSVDGNGGIGSSTYTNGTPFFKRYLENISAYSNIRSGDGGYQMYQGEVLEYPQTETGMYTIYGANNIRVAGSNDGANWTEFNGTPSYDTPIDPAYQHFRYYKVLSWSGSSSYVYPKVNDYDGYNVIFDTPPAQGDVITIDYTTDYIPKDSDHVVDVEITFTFGEWQGN